MDIVKATSTEPAVRLGRAFGTGFPQPPAHRGRPSFAGALGGEIVKLRRQGWSWAMLGVALLLFAVLSLAVLQVTVMRRTLQTSPSLFLSKVSDTGAGICACSLPS